MYSQSVNIYCERNLNRKKDFLKFKQDASKDDEKYILKTHQSISFMAKRSEKRRRRTAVFSDRFGRLLEMGK